MQAFPGCLPCCGTHTPQGYENLGAKRVMELDNPVPTVYAALEKAGLKADPERHTNLK